MAEPAQIRLRDPLRNYRFVVSVEYPDFGVRTTVGGVQRVSGLTCSVGAFEVWEGGNNLHRYANPDKVTWDPVTLEQGLALDDTLEAWARAVRDFAMGGVVVKAHPVKRNVVIDLCEPLRSAGMPESAVAPIRRYRVHNAWISKYSALPKLDALASEVALISIELQHEGWTVEAVTPPTSE